MPDGPGAAALWSAVGDMCLAAMAGDEADEARGRVAALLSACAGPTVVGGGKPAGGGGGGFEEMAWRIFSEVRLFRLRPRTHAITATTV